MATLRTEAFVLEARGPDAGWTTGRQHLSMATRLPSGLLVETQDDPKAKVEQWIVAGMTVPISVDPRKPGRCEVATDAIPPLSRRLADRDWTLCDLEEVRIRERLTRFDLEHGADAPERAAYARELMEWKRQKQAERARRAVTDGDGRLRGTADLISYEVKPSSRSASTDTAGWSGRRLIRVWPDGASPYAILDKVDFAAESRNRGRALLEGGDVPVTIDPADPADVHFLWDEAKDPDLSRGERVIELVLAAVEAGTITQAQLDQGYTDTSAPLRATYLERVQARGLDVSQRHKDFFAS